MGSEMCIRDRAFTDCLLRVVCVAGRITDAAEAGGVQRGVGRATADIE